MSDIETELLEITSVKKQKRGEDRQTYLARLVDAITALDDDQWEGLSGHLQEWANDASTAVKDEQEIPDFPDNEEPAAETTEPEPETESEAESEAEAEEENEGEDQQPEDEPADDPAPAKKPTKKKADPKKAAKSNGKTPEKKAAASKDRPQSMRRMLKHIVVKTPTITIDDLIERLKKKGIEEPTKVTVSQMRHETLDTCRVLVEAGALPEDFLSSGA